MLSETTRQNFLAILKEELIPAMGCTEPIALAYASRTGILQEDTGDTISCVGHIGRVGMQPTDTEIVKIMIGS